MDAFISVYHSVTVLFSIVIIFIYDRIWILISIYYSSLYKPIIFEWDYLCSRSCNTIDHIAHIDTKQITFVKYSIPIQNGLVEQFFFLVTKRNSNFLFCLKKTVALNFSGIEEKLLHNDEFRFWDRIQVNVELWIERVKWTSNATIVIWIEIAEHDHLSNRISLSRTFAVKHNRLKTFRNQKRKSVINKWCKIIVHQHSFSFNWFLFKI